MSSTVDAVSLGRLVETREQFQVRVLTRAHADACVSVLARAFQCEPATSSKAAVDGVAVPFHEWVRLMEFWSRHCTDSRLSVVCLDTAQHRVAGCIFGRCGWPSEPLKRAPHC